MSTDHMIGSANTATTDHMMENLSSTDHMMENLIDHMMENLSSTDHMMEKLSLHDHMIESAKTETDHMIYLAETTCTRMGNFPHS